MFIFLTPHIKRYPSPHTNFALGILHGLNIQLVCKSENRRFPTRGYVCQLLGFEEMTM